jgi:spore germination protein
MGLETGPDGKLLFSMTSPVVSQDAQSKSEFLYTSSENLIRSSREKIRNTQGKLLQGGKIQLVYFSKELAQKGINEFLEIFIRDPENPLLANVVIVDGSPKEMMESSLEFKDKPRPAFYVNNLLLDARRRSAAPEMRIYNFSILSYSKTIDPVAPLIRYDKKKIEVIGSALFSGDKMVGDINTDQTILLNLLMGKSRDGGYTYREEDPNGEGESLKKGTVILMKKPKCKIKIETSGSSPVINIKLSINAFLNEDSGPRNLDDSEKKAKLEEAIADSVKTDVLTLLKQLQTIGSDPIGFGEILRSKQNEYWKSVDWKEKYKSAAYDLDVKLNIKSYGTMR